MSDELELYGTAAGEVAAAVAGTSPAREGLEWAADIIRGRRARTQIKVLSKTAKALKEAGLSANVVPDKTLVPLLEFAGLEDPDEEDMTSRWANLLANAATATTADVLPSFPDILRQLDSAEARALDSLVSDDGAPVPSWTRAVCDAHGLRPEHLDDLERLGLVRFRGPDVWPVGDVNLDAPMRRKETRERIDPTHLGGVFVMACRAPATA
jgi:hypothetical protein